MNMSDLVEFDLERIERYSNHARNNAAVVVGSVKVLRSRRNFETRAEDALRCSEAELERALSAVRDAMAEFNNKPVEHV